MILLCCVLSRFFRFICNVLDRHNLFYRVERVCSNLSCAFLHLAFDIQEKKQRKRLIYELVKKGHAVSFLVHLSNTDLIDLLNGTDKGHYLNSQIYN